MTAREKILIDALEFIQDEGRCGESVETARTALAAYAQAEEVVGEDERLDEMADRIAKNTTKEAVRTQPIQYTSSYQIVGDKLIIKLPPGLALRTRTGTKGEK